MIRILLGIALVSFSPLVTAQDIVAKTNPRTPEEERATFHLPPGFEIQLVAAEPDIHKPLNLNFDDRGRLWVTDTVEYPFPAKEGTRARDTIKILENFDEHGHARTITTFGDDLNIPIGLIPLGLGNRAIVFSIPNLYRLTDTDGDGKADQRELLLGSIGRKDTHGMTSAFTLGFDGWVYACHGYANDSTLKAANGTQIVMNSGNTYRFRPDGSRIEQWTHGQVNPFGLCFDPLGNLFSADCHSKPIYMLLRGAYYPSFGKPDDGLGFAPEMCAHDHGSTAIAGVVYYAADQFPVEYRDTAFIGNVVTNRINHDRLQPQGSGFKAVQQPDFLISDDPWFRPVDLKLGPDGALYVADFYNRIIGHYEVPLTHPGRDRESGRIWRIVYRGADGKIAPPPSTDWTKLTVPQLTQELASLNLVVRMHAMNQLVERGRDTVTPVRALLSPTSNPFQRLHALWILERLGALDDTSLKIAAKDTDRGVRVHAMRVLSEREKSSPELDSLAMAALKDPDATVQRAAADALGTHAAANNVRPLLDALNSVPAVDLHLKHTVRMALRNQLLAPQTLTTVATMQLTDGEMRTVAELAVATPTSESANFLAQYLRNHSVDRATLDRFIHHIARYGGDETVPVLIAFSRTKLAEDLPNSLDVQLSVFKAIQQGTEERGGKLGDEARRWAEELVEKNLAPTTRKASGWTTITLQGEETTAPLWDFEKRHLADGTETLLLSSFPHGETLTGILRSPPFVIPAQLSFYLCGHNGLTDQPDHGKNRIRLRSGTSNEILAEATPPRNDTAQKITWDLKTHAGQQGYLEVVDGDNATAYAWLAFGRLSPSVIDLPEGSGTAPPQRTAFEMIAALHLTRFEGTLTKLLVAQDTNAEIRAAAAKALVELNTPTAKPALLSALQNAPQRLQVTLAVALASNASGAEALLQAIADGKASPHLLRERVVKERLEATKPARLKERIATLTQGMPPADQALQKILEQRRAGFAAAKSDPALGTQVFEKNCAVCHMLHGKGVRIGPQLDGVGIRGPDRLIEDILDPNRNVDPGFRTTILKLNDGRTLFGLILREEGEILTILDDERQEVRIPKNTISTRSASLSSPMPATFTDLISEPDFYHLLAYLLTQREALPAPR